MDDTLDDSFLHSPWTDISFLFESSAWAEDNVDQRNSLFSDFTGAYEENGNQTINMIPSNHVREGPVNEGQSMHGILISSHPNGNSNYNFEEALFMDENQPTLEVMYPTNNEMNSSLRDRMMENTFIPYNSQELCPSSVASIMSNASCQYTAVGSNASNPLGFQHSFEDSQSISLLPSYATCAPPILSQIGKSHGFGSQGKLLENGNNILDHRYVLNEKFWIQGRHDIYNGISYKSNAQHSVAGPQTPLPENGGLQTYHQLSLYDEANLGKLIASPSMSHVTSNSNIPSMGACNGALKPRVRARRGQATDPHSIAERLRRERISKRMKNLQQLVPNSNKTDKASILDEIIEYVKFLQLQMKVLSMSKLGATEAVVPLITDVHVESSNDVPFSTPIDLAVELSNSEDSIALEKQMVQLMETDLKSAMKLLQNKGLCLMPSTLATAIGSGKPLPNASTSNRNNLVHELIPLNNGGSRPLSCESSTKDNKGKATKHESPP